MDTKLLDIYLTEIKQNDLMKLVKDANLKNIIDVISNSTEEEKALILKSVDKDIKKELNKLIKGGLI